MWSKFKSCFASFSLTIHSSHPISHSMADLILRRATTQQWFKSIANTHSEWGSSVSLEDYTERERMLKEETGMGKGFECWCVSPPIFLPAPLVGGRAGGLADLVLSRCSLFL